MNKKNYNYHKPHRQLFRFTVTTGDREKLQPLSTGVFQYKQPTLNVEFEQFLQYICERYSLLIYEAAFNVNRIC